jgi:acyl dehydratase
MPYSYRPHRYEDFETGQTFESVGRTVTEADLVMHSAFTGDWTELHTNRHYAEGSQFKGRVAHGPMTFVLATGFVYRCGFLERTVVAFLGMNYMNIPAPVKEGDTISLDMEVIEKEEFSSREDAGLVVIDTTMTNQDDETVFEGDMKFMVKREE